MFIKVTKISGEGKARALVNSDRILALVDLTANDTSKNKSSKKVGAKTVIILDAPVSDTKECEIYVTDTLDEIIRVNE